MTLTEDSPFWFPYEVLCWHGSYKAAEHLKKLVESLPEPEKPKDTITNG